MKHQTYEQTLKAGGRLAVIHVPGAPIFQIETFVNSGNRYAPVGKYELPHLLEHLAFEGSKRFPDPQVLRYELEKFGILSNAFTSIYMNGYVMYGAMEYWKYIIDLGFEWLLDPIFSEQSIKEQKEVVKNELMGKKTNAESWSSLKTYQLLKNGLIPDYADRIESIKAISREDILSYHAKYYQPKNLLHIVTGDLPKAKVDAIASLIESKLDDLKPGMLHKNEVIIPETPKNILVPVDYPNADSVRFNLNFFQPGYDVALYEKYSIPLRIFETMLNEGDYSRIFSKSRSLGLSYTVGSGYSTGKECMEMEFWDKTQPQHLEPLIKLILDEMQAVASGDFTDQELERAIGYQVGRHATRFQTAMSYTSWYEDVYIEDMPLITPEIFLKQLKAVDRQAVIEAAKYLFSKSNKNRLLVISSKKLVSKDLESLVANFGV